MSKKSEIMEQIVNRELDAGRNVAILGAFGKLELRGPDYAKDITPTSQPAKPDYVTWASVRYKPELVAKTVLIREYSNGMRLYHDLDAKGKKIRIWYY